MPIVEWITPDEAAKSLGLSIRRVLEYATAGELRTQKNGRGRLINFSDVEKLKRAREEKRQGEMQRAAASTSGESKAGLNGITHALTTTVQALVDRTRHSGEPAIAQPQPRIKPWLTLIEAAEYTGLPASYLLKQAKYGALDARDVGPRPGGRWRFSRHSLKVFSGIDAQKH